MLVGLGLQQLAYSYQLCSCLISTGVLAKSLVRWLAAVSYPAQDFVS